MSAEWGEEGKGGGDAGWESGVGSEMQGRLAATHDASKLWRRTVISISPKGILKMHHTQSFALLRKR